MTPPVLDTSPAKRIFYSIIADYDHNLGICELVDNVADIWIRRGKRGKVRVAIKLDGAQQTIEVTDNAGGVPKSRLRYIAGPGHTTSKEEEETIGIFGVGTKRAVVALAQDVVIQTRFRKESTYEVRIDDDWLKKETWLLPYARIENIDEGETVVRLSRLRSPLTDASEPLLRDHLGATYARFLQTGTVEIMLNDEPVVPIEFEDWAYPPSAKPNHYSQEFRVPGDGPVAMNMIVGLAKESSPSGGEYGVYLYCNDRLICRGLRSYDVGFASGLVGNPHPMISLVRAIVHLNGPAKLMPWNSTKSGINPQHRVFQELHHILVPALKAYAQLSRALSSAPGGWHEQVFKYGTGEETEVQIGETFTLPDLHLPRAPRSRPRYRERIETLNEGIVDAKPWTKGLHGGVAAARAIFDGSFEQKNRIALIILDSILEIAFKEYLVNEVQEGISDERLRSLFSNRKEVEAAIRKHVTIANQDVTKIRYYYNMRCDLIHRKAGFEVSDKDIEDYSKVTMRVLKRMFGLRFESDRW